MQYQQQSLPPQRQGSPPPSSSSTSQQKLPSSITAYHVEPKRVTSSRITMQFPTKPATEITAEEQGDAREQIVAMVQAALSIDPEHVLYVGISKELGDLLVEVTFEAFLGIGYHGLKYDAFLHYDGYTRGVIVCCRSSQQPPASATAAANATAASDANTASSFEQQQIDADNASLTSAASLSTEPATDFLSRFFAPKGGINEDPVTGSAHCALAPYFCSKIGKDKVIGKQVSSRGGLIVCRLVGEGKDEVRLTGTAITAISGTLWI